MAQNSPYSDEDVQTALQMTANGVTVAKICEHVGISRQTYYNWRNEGRLTDGTPWDEWLEDHNSFEIMRQKNEQTVIQVESSDQFWEEQLPKLRQAIQSTTDKLAQGEIPLDASDLKEIVGLVRNIENRGKELAMMQEKFMRAVFFALREELDSKHKFMVIKERIKEIRLDQLEDFDEDFAKTMLEDVE